MSRSDPLTGLPIDGPLDPAGAKNDPAPIAGAEHGVDDVDDLRIANEQLRARNEELQAARSQLADRLAEIEAIYDHAPVGMALFNRDGRFVRINPRLAQINGVAVDGHIGRTADEIAPEMAEAVNASLNQVLETGEPIRHDRVMGFLNDHSEQARMFDIEWYPVFRSGQVDGVSVLVDDVTEAQRNDLFARHMVRELQHRVKNSLANVMALVEQALRSDRRKDEALHILKERLTALAQVHGKLTERNWESIDLRILVDQEFGRDERPGRIEIEGPAVEFGPQSSLAMSMTLHELATNARRYGGLSCSRGKLAIHWRIVGEGKNGHMFLRWRESGCDGLGERGNPGFGSRLIATSVRSALRGELSEQWMDDGLCVELRLPLTSVWPPEREFPAAVGKPLNRAS